MFQGKRLRLNNDPSDSDDDLAIFLDDTSGSSKDTAVDSEAIRSSVGL